MKIVELSVKYRIVVICLALLGLICGFIEYLNAPRREDPEFTIRACTVIVRWPGADAQKIEDLAVEPLERAIEQIDEVKETETTVISGTATVKVTMEDYVTDVDQICDKIRSRVDGVAMPAGVTSVYVNSNYGDTCAMVLALYQNPDSKKKYSMRELEKLCEEMRDQLSQLKDVASVTIMSAPQEAIYIEPNAGSWDRIDITIDQIKQRLSSKNKLMPGGVIDTGKQLYNVSVEGDYNVVNEIKNTIATVNSNNMPVALKSLGFKVKRDYMSPLSILTRYSDSKIQSQRCIILYFTMKKQKNIISLGKIVRKKLKEWRQTIIPPDVNISIVSDQPKTVDENIGVFSGNLVQSIIILFFVAWLLIGFRIAVIMGTSIPVIVMISFAIARCFNVQLESMSIASLIISLGMLVDCGIEICDNVHRLQDEGISRFNSVVEGVKQVLFPILIGTLTTVFAFLPMIMVPGNMGEYIRSIPIVVSVTLLVSWIISITFTTVFTWILLKPGGNNMPPINCLFNYVANKLHLRKKEANERESFTLYKRLLLWGMNNRAVIFTGVIALFVLTVAFLKMDVIKTDFIPSAGGKQFLIDIWLPEGTSISETSDVCKEIENIVSDANKEIAKKCGIDPLDNIISVVGESMPRFKLSAKVEFPKSNFAQILVNAKYSRFVQEMINIILKRTEVEVTKARINLKRIGLGPNVRYPIIIRVTGSDYFILKKYSAEVTKVLDKIPGTLDVHDSWGNLAPQINIIPDDEKSAAAGISRTTAANTLNAFFSGTLLTTFREGDHTIPVYFRLPHSERNRVDKLKELYIEGRFGKVPLSSVAKINITFKPVRIERFKQQRNMEVLSLVQNGFLATSIIKKAMPELEEIQKRMPAGYKIEPGGTYEKSVEGSGHIGNSMLIALALIVVCLLVYFNSIIKTIAVLVTLPLACTGAFLGLFIMNQPLGFFAQLGLLALFGIVVNGAIVLFDFIGMIIDEKAREVSGDINGKFKGLCKEQFIECIVEAASLRIRPIMLTVFTTIGGLMPLAISGGPLFEPLAVVAIFGLFYSTILTLLLMPIIYYTCVDKFHMKINRTEDPTLLD